MSVQQDPVTSHGGTIVDGVDVLGALSPSRAGDFISCPLLYRFRTIDRLPEPPSPDALRGTVVHKVLEDLFDLPSPERTPERAGEMLEPAWEQGEPVEGVGVPAVWDGSRLFVRADHVVFHVEVSVPDEASSRGRARLAAQDVLARL